MKTTEKFVIGIDYGTDSCRAIIVNTDTGVEMATAVSYYRRWAEGKYCNPVMNQYRQHPQDYIDSLLDVIKTALSQCLEDVVEGIRAIGIDTTGSTPCLVNRMGIPLALMPEHSENPNAMFILWKDHTAINEANDINKLAHSWDVDYTAYSGGIYSSEWFWAKALHVLRKDDSIRKDAYSIIEHCDWMPALLTGNMKPESVKRSRCAAGHKCLWNEQWGGYPSQKFLSNLDPLFDGFGNHLNNETYTNDVNAGTITREWATKLGLPFNTIISVGIIDAHSGAIGAEIKAGSMVKIIGTSTCDIVVSSKSAMKDKFISGISGQVDGSVIPDMIGIEAGQSAFGDVYAWFRDILSWTLIEFIDNKTLNESIKDKIIPYLSEKAQSIATDETSLVSLDWLNGRRSPFADQTLKGVISGLTLGTTPPSIFKSLVEATAFGSKAIMEHLQKEGVKISEVIAVGGISKKSPYVMQTLSDIMGVPIKVAAVDQAGALGAAMCAAIAAGLFSTITETQIKLGKGVMQIYYPIKINKNIYANLYTRYIKLGSFM